MGTPLNLFIADWSGRYVMSHDIKGHKTETDYSWNMNIPNPNVMS